MHIPAVLPDDLVVRLRDCVALLARSGISLPFADAIPLNGCMYVLPAHSDDRFRVWAWDGPDNTRVYDPQAIRALPATAGTFRWRRPRH